MPKLQSVLLLILMLAGGCFFEPYRPTAVFDLEVSPVGVYREFRVLELLNNSSSGSRIQTRFADGRVVADPYNRWALPPGELVANALNRSFTLSGVVSPLPITGAVEVFEVDRPERVFRLAGYLTFPGEREREFRFRITSPVEGEDAAAVAAAASRAVRELAESYVKAVPAGRVP